VGHYPGSVDSEVPATTYGPLPDHGKTNVKLVLHTTETVGMPGFNHGDSAPHYVYNPTTREWTMWAEYEDGYVGTLKGHTSAGHGNCQAFQVEILGYSDPNHSPWVGDFTNENMEDLAEFYAWAMDRYGIGTDLTPVPDGGWLYGVSSPHRLCEEEWDEFSGLTCHGAVPMNTHYDTGVLDLDYIHSLALGEDDMTYRTVINVPDASYARDAVDWAIEVGLVKIEDNNIDDWTRNLEDGRFWTFMQRMDARWSK